MKLLKFSLLNIMILFFPLLLTAQEDPTRFEDEIKEFEKMDAKHGHPDGVNLFVGSSSIRMWDDMVSNFPGYFVLNRGFGGSQFSDLIYYADRLIYPYKPVKVFIYEGDNDIAAGEDPKEILKEAKELRKMIAENLGKDVPVFFISPKPSVARWNLKDKYEDLNQILKRYASKEDKTEFIDVWTPALDENGEVQKDIFLEDNLHMNKKGYIIWQTAILPYLNMP
ncbi:MAG: SGNH/GDSL hydrolase family protein [Saprospiraceae bacterium]